MNTKVELARYYDDLRNLRIVTIQNYLDYINTQNKEEIANFVFQRLHSRYLKPFKFNDEKYKNEYKNGFSIMANCCLLIVAF